MNDVFLSGVKAAFFFMAAVLFATALLTAKIIFLGIACLACAVVASVDCYLVIRKYKND